MSKENYNIIHVGGLEIIKDMDKYYIVSGWTTEEWNGKIYEDNPKIKKVLSEKEFKRLYLRINKLKRILEK